MADKQKKDRIGLMGWLLSIYAIFSISAIPIVIFVFFWLATDSVFCLIMTILLSVLSVVGIFLFIRSVKNTEYKPEENAKTAEPYVSGSDNRNQYSESDIATSFFAGSIAGHQVTKVFGKNKRDHQDDWLWQEEYHRKYDH